jgi:hypothetical protein
VGEAQSHSVASSSSPLKIHSINILDHEQKRQKLNYHATWWFKTTKSARRPCLFFNETYESRKQIESQTMNQWPIVSNGEPLLTCRPKCNYLHCSKTIIRKQRAAATLDCGAMLSRSRALAAALGLLVCRCLNAAGRTAAPLIQFTASNQPPLKPRFSSRMV